MKKKIEKVADDCLWSAAWTKMPHTRRELNLLVARFQNDLIFGNTEVFFVASGCGDKDGTATWDAETNASFHPDGSSNTGSSPMSSDRIDVRKRASSSSRAGGTPVP
jgi:hypothetical protein